MKRENYSTGAQWESVVAYSRAVKIGNAIEVSGTVAIQEGKVIGIGDPYLQTVRILEIISECLEKAGSGMKDVIRTRIYLTNIDHWPEVARAHKEFFIGIMPATSMIGIDRLISDDFLVEIEASALIAGD